VSSISKRVALTRLIRGRGGEVKMEEQRGTNHFFGRLRFWEGLDLDEVTSHLL